MKGQFYDYMMKEKSGELYDYLVAHPIHRLPQTHKHTFATLLKKLEEGGTSEHILGLMEEKYAEYMAPAGRMPSKAEKEQIVLRCLLPFQTGKPSFDVERYEFEENGFTYHVRRSYLPDRNNPVSEHDVEYRIQATNIEFCRTKKEYVSWSCWVYINRPGFLGCGEYSSIPGTEYGVQWYKGF